MILHAGSTDPDSLVRDSMPLVKRVALSFARRLPSHVELSDLVQAGYLGLLDAARKFDRGRGASFQTYAELRIRGAVLDSLRELDWLPRTIRRRRREWSRAAARLETELGRAPEEEELARELGLTARQLRRTRPHLGGPDGPLELSEGDALGGAVEDPAADTPHEILEQSEIRDVLARGIESLSERERLVVTLYYYEELTMKEVGSVLGVNESRVSQIHRRALERLRRRVRPHLRPDPLPMPKVSRLPPREARAESMGSSTSAGIA